MLRHKTGTKAGSVDLLGCACSAAKASVRVRPLLLCACALSLVVVGPASALSRPFDGTPHGLTRAPKPQHTG